MPNHPMYKISGDVSCPYFARAKRCGDLLKAALKLSDADIVIDAHAPESWQPQAIYDSVGYVPNEEHQNTPGNVIAWVPLTKTVIGGEAQFADVLKQRYGVTCDLPWSDCVKLAHDAHILFKYIQDQKAKLRPAVSVLLPPIPHVSGLQVAQRVAERMGWACASGGEAVKVHMMQRPSPHMGAVQPDVVKPASQMFPVVSPYASFHQGPRPPQAPLTGQPSQASAWACEGLTEGFEASSGPVVVLNAPRDEAQVLLLGELAARWRAVVAVDVRDDPAVGAPGTGPYAEYASWVKRTGELAVKAGVPVVYLRAVADPAAMVDAVVAACLALPE